jgi:hypothetical protein
MTEHMFTPAGSQPAIGDALQLAEEIHNSMVTGNYSAYVYWWIWDDPADSINYGLINSDTTAPAPTYYGYAIGQFSKFIQPGYVMVSATNPVLGVFDSAYMGDGNLVIVAINSNITATSFPVTIQGQAATSFTPYQTSATNTMTQLTPVSVTGGVFTYSLPAQSITTFVASASTAPGFTLSPSASNVSVTQSKTATDTISVADLNGFTGSVSLAVSGVPAGVTATLGTNPTTGSSVLTFTANSTATTGAATVTVTGTSGTLTETATISLFVGSDSCNIVYTISPQSSSAFGGAITIDNTSTTALSNWALGWTFANAQTVSQLWNGVETQSGANVTVINESYNGDIPAGGSLSQVGFNGTWNGVTNAVPTSFTLNGVTCSGGSGTGTGTGSFTLAPSENTLSVTQGSSVTDTITVTDVSPVAGSVTLSASGLPTGVTASFGTNPATGTSVVTFAASATATTGPATVTITGTSGTLTASTTIALTVASAAGSFTLASSAKTLSVTQGGNATDTITVTDISPFAGSATLAATGLPTGVTVTFSTNPAAGTSLVMFTASATATAGASTVTITATSGTLSASTTIALTVAPSTPGGCTIDYTISPQNTSAFGASITIINNASTALSSWTLTWAFPNGQTVSSLWTGVETQSGANVTVTNEPYNGSIPTGGSLTGIGFNGTWDGVTNAIPGAFSINGTACTVN